MVRYFVFELVEPSIRLLGVSAGRIRFFGLQFLFRLLSLCRFPLDLFFVVDGQLAMILWR